MRKVLLCCPSFFLIAACAVAQDKAPTMPYTPSLDPQAMDKSADPCADFYRFSCGGWQKSNPIPPDQTSWSVYGKLYQDNLNFLRGILDEAATAKRRDVVTREIGDFYGACMDEAGVEKRGLASLQADLDAIAKLKSAKDVTPLLARLQFAYGRTILFAQGSTQDPDDSEQQIAEVDQGGLGLPDRDYYLKDDAKSKEIRDRYVQHVQKVFELMGEDPAAAKNDAATVMRMETAFAKAQLSRVDRRDPYKLKHKMKVADLAQLAPNIDWQRYYKDLKYPAISIMNVATPDYFKQISAQLTSDPIADWKTYLRFHVVDSSSPFLPARFVDENFEFYRKYLRGAKEQQPRWKRCVQYTDRDLGEALGQAYVKKLFSPEIKAATLDMTRRVEEAMALRIRELDWMSPETKQQALAKLAGIRNKIGYPDKWRDYSSVKIARDDFAGNVSRTQEFERRRDINKVGQPVDHGEWGMTPPTVNAYYNPQMNDVNFAAGVLQPPLYDAKLDDAPNYGDTGGTIGHELTHAFDDEGSQFDAKGNLKDWWTKDDRAKFDTRTKCVQDQYAGYVVVDDIHINSKLTLGEDVADLGGEILAYIAWKDATKGKTLEARDGLTPDQRFFVGFAQWACANEREEDMRVRAATDPHSPAKYRVNGVVVNMPEFSQAFSCKAGQPMVNAPDKVCKVW
ncbi:MAG: M13 family metallopeptidase [Candidatus Koribacter versatilis]|uniref:M13 family metallopeptidase n=1 Tax=Candidatus Korobacter versatilis TaxID=658062 RepID=A0A932A5Q9_9BACT|nr:M13 family metallopeptidase [Candidatus Koribacter versatilis]